MNATLRTTLIATCSAVLLAATLPGCAVVRDQEPVGAYVDDSIVTSRVKAKFAGDKTVSALAIGVETLKGVVQLSGFAKSGEEKATAESLARATPGVTQVRNDIVVKS